MLGALTLALALGFPLARHLRAQRRLHRDAQDALHETQQRFRALTENAFDLVTELDGDERLTYVNPRCEDVLGHPPEALLGRRPVEFVHSDDVPAAQRFAEDASRDGSASGVVLRIRHRDGGLRWLENAARSFVAPNGERRWVMSSRDVTRRHALEETRERDRERLAATVVERTDALQESEARFRALADHAPELISEFDDRARYVFANAAFRHLLGREPGELLGTSPEDLIHPEDREASRRSMSASMQRGGTAHAVHRLRHADDTWRWFDNTGRSYRTAAGELRFVSIGRDVTESRHAEEERRRFESHVQEVQRLESLGVLAGGIAHDFNNLLAVILGNTSLLEGGVPTGSDARERLGRIRAAARHAQGLTEQMLTYAGRSVSKLLPLDVSDVVRETDDLLQASVSKAVRLELELATDLPPVAGDATQLRQVLVNLVTNASEALGDEGGRVRVRTEAMDVDADALAHAFGTAEVRAGRWIVLEISDDGPGVDEALRARIFEPFYSTKCAGRGLGLAAVLGIASAHGGLVTLDSEPGRGTTFRLLLPPRGAREAHAPHHPAVRAPPGTAAVLVVDDEEPVRDVAQRLLERAGCHVVAASSGREALARLRQGLAVDAVLLDLVMPDLSGPRTLRALREEWPDLPVVVASGYTRSLVRERIGSDVPFGFVQKPYDAQALLDALGEVLAPARDRSPDG